MTVDLTKKYALAVSGGVDSMTMLHMFAALCPRPDFYVVTVNHNIRPEAQADCDFVKSYCDSINVECRIVSVDVPAYAEQNKLSEETAARILRYKALDGLECDYVCLAHHTGDNAETVFMHILRGSGARGASGIRSLNGKYFRPLLDMTREEIELYARKNNVPSVTDSTNDNTKYTRNFIRKNVLPQLKKLNPNAEQNIVRFAENIAADSDYLDSLVSLTDVQFFDGGARIPTADLTVARPLAYRLINRVFCRLGVCKDIERTHVEALIGLANGVGGKQVNLPFGFTATNDYDFVTVQQAAETVLRQFEIPFSIGDVSTPLGTVTVSKNPLPNSLKFDLNSLPQNAVFRGKRQGDDFTKFGGGSKPLRRYLTDKKVPQRLRSQLLLLAADNEVYVIVGLEISDKVKVDGNSDTYYIALREAANEIQ